MIDERQVIEILRDDRVTAPGLDPDRVIQGARRRRTRRNTGAVVASAAVAGVAVAGYVVADRPGGTPDGLATTAPVAGSSTATPRSTSKPTVTPTVKPTARATWDPSSGDQSRTPMMPPGTPRDYDSRPVDWKPGGPSGARPIGTIRRSGKVAIGDGYWFETKGTDWCITMRDAEAPGGTIEPFGCRGTVGNDNIRPADLGQQSSGRYVTSVFEGDLRRVIYTADDKYFEAKLYRLAGIPGWMLAVGDLPPGSRNGHQARAVFGYDAAGKLVYPGGDVDLLGPPNDPLQSR